MINCMTDKDGTNIILDIVEGKCDLHYSIDDKLRFNYKVLDKSGNMIKTTSDPYEVITLLENIRK